LGIVVPGRIVARHFSAENESEARRKKKVAKKKEKSLWKLTLLMEIRKERGFPQQLENSLAKDARLFHSSHRPNNKDLSILTLQASDPP
jgi:hypothetical protein